jgi:putative hemolysin
MIISLIILSLLLFFSAFLSCSETALFSLSVFTLRSYKFDPDGRKRLISYLLEKPKDLLVTILILNTLCNVLVQNTVSNIFGLASSWFLKVGVPLVLTLFLGEVIPKSIAITNNKAVAYKVSPYLSFVAKILGPIRRVVTFITTYFSRIMFFFIKKENPLSMDELHFIIESSKKTGVLNVDEAELASGYLDLQEAIVREIMRPKEEIVFYDIDAPFSKLIEMFVDKKCSRVPVCKGGLEKVLGIISVTDFFINFDDSLSAEGLTKMLKKAFYIPESTNGCDLLKTMRENKEQFALVVDEYGNVAGLITQEDLMETVVGEIEDVRDTKMHYSRPSPDVIIAEGKMELAEIEDLFETQFERRSSVVTIGGWLTDELEKIPQTGDKYYKNDFLFYILEASPQKVNLVYIRRMKRKR